MNPRTVNSTNISQFGFKTIVDLENKKLIFDISELTVFETGGAAAVTGISWEVIDPNGVTIHELQWVTPDLDPNLASVFEVDLPSNMAVFGYYKVRGVIRESDGVTDYEVVIPPKDVCEPKGFDGVKVIGSIKEKVDCRSPYIRLNETTDLTYLSKKYSSITKVGNLYYPLGTVSAVSFTKTPFQNDTVYTGDYVVRNKSVADYDLGDYFYVRIAYHTNSKFTVTCESRLCDVICCLEDLQSDYMQYCNTSRGADARRKFEEIGPYVLNALAKEACGKDSGPDVDKIKKILNCDCNCNPKLIEPSPASAGGGDTITVEGLCAVDVEEEVEGSNTNFVVKVKSVVVAKGDLGDVAFNIQKVEDNCSIVYKITFDYEVFAATLLASDNAVEIINTLIGDYISSNVVNTVDLDDVDGRCVIDLTKCNYNLSYNIPVDGATVQSAIINGTNYAAGSIAVNNPVAVEAWLNALGLGTYDITYNPDGTGGIFGLSSLSNGSKPVSLTFNVSGTDVTKNLIAQCKTLEEILDAIIEYVCAITTLQMRLGVPLSIASIDSGNVITTPYAANIQVSQFLQSFMAAYATLVSTVNSLTAPTCSSVVGLFGTSGAPIAGTDFFLGTIGGTCGKATIKQLAIAILKMAQDDGEVKAEFCAVSCSADSCPAVKDVIAFM